MKLINLIAATRSQRARSIFEQGVVTCLCIAALAACGGNSGESTAQQADATATAQAGNAADDERAQAARANRPQTDPALIATAATREELKAIAEASLAANPRQDHPQGTSSATSPSVNPGNDFTQGIPGDDIEQTAVYSIGSITGEQGGYDIFNAVNPADVEPGKALVTAFYAGLSSRQVDAPGDRFLLGSHTKAWYLGRTGDVDNDFARILDFDSRGGNQVVLHGTASNYTMVVTEGDEVGTAIFYNNGGVHDMIGFIDGQELTDPGNAVYQYATMPSAAPVLGAQMDQFGGPGADLITAIAADARGNVYVTGVSRSDLAGVFPAGGGTGQMFAAKYSSTGQRVWLRQFGSAEQIGDLAWDIAIDSSAVYIAARYIAPDSEKGALKDAAYFKLSAVDGSILSQADWAEAKVQYPGAVALDNGEYVYFTGIGWDPAQPNPDNSQDPFIEKRKRSDLSLVKRVMFGGDKDNVPGSGGAQNKEPWGGLSFVPKSGGSAGQGTIYSAGWTKGAYEGTTDLGGGDLWLVAFDQDLKELWAEGWGSNQRDWAWDMDVDKNGFVYVVGMTFGEMAGAGSHKGQSDGFISKIDPGKAAGQRVVWTRQLGTSKSDELRKVKIVGDSLYISGHTYGAIVGANAGDSDLWIAKLDLNGNVLQQVQIGTAEDDRGMVAANMSSVFVGGYTSGSLVETSKGFIDAFVLELTTSLTNP